MGEARPHTEWLGLVVSMMLRRECSPEHRWSRRSTIMCVRLEGDSPLVEELCCLLGLQRTALLAWHNIGDNGAISDGLLSAQSSPK
jgi:hypothetical protein